MGDPRKQQKKYERPLIPWDERRIVKEKEILRNYGLRRKKEILQAQSFLRNLRRGARNAAAKGSEESKKELIEKCKELGLIEGEEIEDILRIELEEVLERRLQSVVSRIPSVKTPKQARQFVVHGHVRVGERKITSPSFLVPKELEEKVNVDERVTESD